jgi:adenylate cyclase
MTGAQMVQDDLPKALKSPDWVVRTVLFVDVVESVRLMEENESDVVRRWRQFVSVVERDILPSHGGRLVKSHGDGMLLEFPVVPPAAKAAFAVQRALSVSRRASIFCFVWACIAVT